MDLYENELIKPVPGFEEHYYITSMGRVWSTYSNKWLIPTANRRGQYVRYYVSLGRGNKRYIHRLVAEAFLDNPLSLPEIDHIDTDPTNNCVENLRWVTHDDNMANPMTADKIKTNTGYLKEIIDVQTGETFIGVKAVCEKYNVCKATVTNHLTNKVKNPRWQFTGNRFRPNT